MVTDQQRKTTGRRGEDLACSYLVEHGHVIVRRNCRCGNLETDIITYDSDGIHFVEVKTRREPVQADPLESVGRVKQQRLARAANRFLLQLEEESSFLAGRECFFDVITIVFDGDKTTLNYYPQAFIPIYT